MNKGDTAAYRNSLRHDPCAYCGGCGGAIDHIDPKSMGGARTFDNESGTCSLCNSRKGQLKPLQFLLREYHLGQLVNIGIAGGRTRELTQIAIGVRNRTAQEREKP